MFESIVSKIGHVVRNTFQAIGAATRHRPWVIPAILGLFLVFV